MSLTETLKSYKPMDTSDFDSIDSFNKPKQKIMNQYKAFTIINYDKFNTLPNNIEALRDENRKDIIFPSYSAAKQACLVARDARNHVGYKIVIYDEILDKRKSKWQKK